MYLINATYFIREYVIPNAAQSDKADGVNVGYYVDEKVRLFLRLTLGDTNAISLDGDVNQTTGALEPTAAQRWKDLVNGKTYTKNDKTYVWQGLLRTEGTFKSSLLTPMVYHAWLEEEYSKMSGSGEVTIMPKNARVVNSTQRLVRAWNDFVTQYQSESSNCGRHHMHNGVLVYDWFGGEDGNETVSMRKFILDNIETYPDAPMPILKIKNQLGL